MHPSLPLILVVLGIGACRSAPPTVTPDAGDRCASRDGGAAITVKVNDQTFRFWSTSSAFIDRAAQLMAAKKPATIMFKTLVDGSDCDSRWTFHVHPAQMDWPQLTTEVCDGRPSDVDGDKKHWIKDVKRWCPWSSLVVSIEDRRGERDP